MIVSLVRCPTAGVTGGWGEKGLETEICQSSETALKNAHREAPSRLVHIIPVLVRDALLGALCVEYAKLILPLLTLRITSIKRSRQLNNFLYTRQVFNRNAKNIIALVCMSNETFRKIRLINQCCFIECQSRILHQTSAERLYFTFIE
jgi:hypothetical protein